MRSANERLEDILKGILMIPQVKDTVYESIIENSVPIIISKMLEQNELEDILEYFYDMEDPSELEDLINSLIINIKSFELSDETKIDIMDIIRRECEES